MIPKVFTTAEQSPRGVVDTTSALYNFLDGMSFTYEQLTTLIDLLQRQRSYSTMPHGLPCKSTRNFGVKSRT
jgi:hypothetical protein